MKSMEQHEQKQTNPEAAAPLGGGPIQLGGLRAVGEGARVSPPKVPAEAGSEVVSQATAELEAGVDPGSVYAQVGGEPTFRKLVAAFYRQVPGDPIMGPMYPEDDLGGAEERLRLFLIQYFGGPGTYSEQRGHPRLRMRHFPFAVDFAARDAWLRHMRIAMDEVELPPLIDAMMWDYFERAAHAMVNTAG